MTVHRIMGIETEYGILQQGNAYANPMLMSSQIVTAYQARLNTTLAAARWDYEDENPLVDARGFSITRASAHPSMLTDDPDRAAPSGDCGEPLHLNSVARPTNPVYVDPGAANAILTNGARLYVDHAHPEYSSPEFTNPLDGVRWDVAGERIMLSASREVAATMGIDISLFKNNTDSKGASYGTHENYLLDREVPFAVVSNALLAFFVTRQVFTGSGRVGLGTHSQLPGFQLSQRADFMEAEVGLETTMRRPIVNTRDEPHADRERWRRLHVIVGDANLMQTATYLKLGSTSLILWLIENLAEHDDLAAQVRALELADPVGDIKIVSRDLALTAKLDLKSGDRLTALEIQRRYLDLVMELGSRLHGSNWDAATGDVLDRWESVLERLGNDPMSCARDVEWVAKLRLLTAAKDRANLTWDHPKLAMMDILWSDVRPERSLYERLVAAGAIETLVRPSEIDRAQTEPPADTRAYFRGTAIKRFSPYISSASWDSVIFDVPGAPALRRVAMMDPARGTEAHVGSLFARHSSPQDFLTALLGG